MSEDKIIAVGCDHGGYELKEYLVEELKNMDYRILDMGTNGPESVDYPEFAAKVAKAILNGDASKGVLVCGTGIGISMAANRFRGIRAALCTSVEMAELTRLHNNSNIIAMGGRTTSNELALEMLKTFLNTEYEGGRHDRRVNDIDNVENL